MHFFPFWSMVKRKENILRFALKVEYYIEFFLQVYNWLYCLSSPFCLDFLGIEWTQKFIETDNRKKFAAWLRASNNSSNNNNSNSNSSSSNKEQSSCETTMTLFMGIQRCHRRRVPWVRSSDQNEATATVHYGSEQPNVPAYDHTFPQILEWVSKGMHGCSKAFMQCGASKWICGVSK